MDCALGSVSSLQCLCSVGWGVRAGGGVLTSVGQPEALPALGVVAGEADEGLVRGAEQRGRQVGAAELAEQRAGGVRPVLDLQEVVVGLRGEVQEPDVRT